MPVHRLGHSLVEFFSFNSFYSFNHICYLMTYAPLTLIYMKETDPQELESTPDYIVGSRRAGNQTFAI